MKLSAIERFREVTSIYKTQSMQVNFQLFRKIFLMKIIIYCFVLQKMFLCKILRNNIFMILNFHSCSNYSVIKPFIKLYLLELVTVYRFVL